MMDTFFILYVSSSKFNVVDFMGLDFSITYIHLNISKHKYINANI
jgi:hypothetical protein